MNPNVTPNPGDDNLSLPHDRNAQDPTTLPTVETTEDIVSVNKKGSAGDNKLAKGIFVLVVGSVLIGGLAWFGQNWFDAKKTAMRQGSGPKSGEPAPNLFNPEKTALPVKPKLGSESGIRPSGNEVAQAPAGQKADDCVRPLRGPDGKVMINPQGQAMAVDCEGKIITVPAIQPIGGEQAAAPAGSQQNAGAPPPKPPSRYGGSLFVAAPSKAALAAGAPSGAPAPTQGGIDAATQALKALGGGGAAPAATGANFPTLAPRATPFPGQPPGVVYNPNENNEPRVGSVGAALHASATPVALAKRFPDQFLMLPKGRQADCILTGRIIDEVPGFTSCVLAQNLYSDNGRVLLLERGSELSGEYGITNQSGSERLFVTWQRIKTPLGIEIDLGSPGADRLGTSGLPGHLDNRWGARLASALLISLVQDVSVAVINRQSATSSSGSNNVSVASPGQNTANASGQLAEEVIKQTLKVRPRLTINEGSRISIYVARDLDFSPVYALRESGTAGATRLLTQ